MTVSGLQDANDEPASALFTHTPSGGGYDGAETGDVFVLVNDDENPATPLTPSVLVSQAELTIDEGGSGTYTVVLGHAPTADVTVAVAQTVAVRIGGILSLGTGPEPGHRVRARLAHLYRAELGHAADGDGERAPGRGCFAHSSALHPHPVRRRL